MARSIEGAVVCPVLIGRDRYLASLDRLMPQVADGRGQVIAVSGEAGLGKSRLVAETKARIERWQRDADQPPFLVVQGSCFEPDASLPYAPLLDLMRTCFATHSPADIAACTGSDAPDLARLLPEITTIVPDLAPAPALDPDQEKRRLFQALLQFFTRLAARQPLLIVLEDVHWSDDTSIEFLSHFARRIALQPILLLVTYRSDEVQPALRHFLAGLDRERIVVDWPLGAFARDEVDTMIQAIFSLGHPVRTEFLDAIYSLTEGNPFFIEEVLKSLVTSGDIDYLDGRRDGRSIDDISIPRSVHDAVRARTEQLGADAQRVLTLAAVTGRRFDFALLQQLSGCDEHELLALIKELMRAQLVVEDSADHFAFRHALTQQAIYTDLLARERRSLHAAVAEATRTLYAGAIDAHLADLAHHFYQAGQWDEAYYYSRRLGDSASTLNAPAAAIEHYTRALEAARQLQVRVPASLYRARGRSYETIGDFDRARSDYEQAFDATRQAADGPAEWQSLIDLGFLWSVRDYERTGAFFRRAAGLADTLGDALLKAHSLNRLGNWLVNTGRPREGIEDHRQALAIFEEQADLRGTGETLDLMGMAYGIYGATSACIESYGRAIEILRPLGPSLELASSFTGRATFAASNMSEVTFTTPCRIEQPAGDAAEAMRIAERLGSQSQIAFILWSGGAAYAGFGDFGECIRRAREGLRVSEEIEHQQWITGAQYTLGQTYVLMLAPDLAIEHLEPALVSGRAVGSAWWIGNTSTYLALAHLQRGDLAPAEAVLDAAMTRDRDPDSMAERRMLWAWAQIMLEKRRPADALQSIQRLLDTAPGSPRPQHIPSLLHVKGDALAALKRPEEALDALEHAKQGAIERGARPYLWQIHRSLGRLHQTARRHEDADREFAEARAVIAGLAATIDDQHLREHFERAALESLPKPKQLSANRAAKEAFGGLTAREREVAALIAQGKSNRDMAEELVLGERTIETHVGNVLSKLGFTSRAQIAAWAVETGLSRR